MSFSPLARVTWVDRPWPSGSLSESVLLFFQKVDEAVFKLLSFSPLAGITWVDGPWPS